MLYQEKSGNPVPNLYGIIKKSWVIILFFFETA
jgi:hypothetical protein